MYKCHSESIFSVVKQRDNNDAPLLIKYNDAGVLLGSVERRRTFLRYVCREIYIYMYEPYKLFSQQKRDKEMNAGRFFPLHETLTRESLRRWLSLASNRPSREN